MAVRRGRKAKRKKSGRQIAQEVQGQEKEQEQAGQEQAGQELVQLEQLALLLAMKEVHSWGTDEGATQQIPKTSCFPQRDFSYIN